MSIYKVLPIIFLFTKCTTNVTSLKNPGNYNFYDSIQNKQLALLDSLNLRRFDTSARWLLYTIHCDDSAYFGKSRGKVSLIKTPLSFLKLSLVYSKKDKDTLTLAYLFLYDDSTYVQQLTNSRLITDGVVFDTKNDKVIGFNIGDILLTTQAGDSISRYENPLQKEVITFLQFNKNRLNKWLRNEALFRKIIK